MGPARTQLDISLDLAAVHEAAERVRGMLLDMRERFDLSSFEYTSKVRIAPLEIPHSHPVLTLNTWVRDDLGLLLMYVHEQMHWYVTWYSHAHAPEWDKLLCRLRERYPKVPVGGRDGGSDEYSSYLHLIVNWCEVDVAARFLSPDEVAARARELPFYRWIYETVIDDGQALATLFADHGLVPIRSAMSMSEEDLKLAALADEAGA
jgi:hypothetical protein